MKRISHLFLFLSFYNFIILPALAQAPIKTDFVSGTGPNDEEGPQMVCDGNLATKWCIDSRRQMPYTIVLDAGRQIGLAEYGLATGDDTSSYPERNPITWEVKGSNDKQTWTTLDNRRNDRSLPAEDFQEYRFTPTGPGAKDKFRYYSFTFHRMAGGSRIQLSEISLYDKPQLPVKATFVGGTGASGKEGAAMVADGRLFSKWCIDEPRQMPYSVVLDAGEKIALSEYRFVTGDDTHSYPQRNPITWRVSGSNDQKSWTTLDEQKNNRRMRDENEQEYRFKPAASADFRYYRFEFLKMADGTRLQLSEIKIYR